jgi:hypothetical protein
MRLPGLPLGSALLSSLLALLLVQVPACRSGQKAAPAASASVRPSALPLDHLAEGELAPSKQEVFGFPVPVGMRLENNLGDRAYLLGRIPPEHVANYVRQHVVVSHVELGAARTVFPQARIKGGPAGRVYTLEVVPDRLGTRLIIKDVTPPPPPPPGLTEEERWRAAGMSPDGRPLDLKKLE